MADKIPLCHRAFCTVCEGTGRVEANEEGTEYMGCTDCAPPQGKGVTDMREISEMPGEIWVTPASSPKQSHFLAFPRPHKMHDNTRVKYIRADLQAKPVEPEVVERVREHCEFILRECDHEYDERIGNSVKLILALLPQQPKGESK